jgi:hypothetical protein
MLQFFKLFKFIGGIMTKCLICEQELTIDRLSCKSCNSSYSGEFRFPRLARLSLEEQRLAESLILHGGNLKEMAQSMEISYPTLKKRLNELTQRLEQKKADDAELIEQILTDIEAKKIDAEEGIKLIREINGEL